MFYSSYFLQTLALGRASKYGERRKHDRKRKRERNIKGNKNKGGAGY